LLTDVSEVRAAAIIALMVEAACTSETSVDSYFTRQYIPEDKSELHLPIGSVVDRVTDNTDREDGDITRLFSFRKESRLIQILLIILYG
jgi:hypothetical protein